MEQFYKNRIYLFITVIGFIILLAYSCKKDEPQPSQSNQELFWVTNKGSQMPVLMIGNKESASIVLFIHGGPGSSSIDITGIYTGNSPAKKSLLSVIAGVAPYLRNSFQIQHTRTSIMAGW